MILLRIFMILPRYKDGRGDRGGRDKSLLVLMEAVEEVIGDDRILDRFCTRLDQNDYTPSKEVLGKFKNKKEMGIYYCDLWIQRGVRSADKWKERIMTMWKDDHGSN